MSHFQALQVSYMKELLEASGIRYAIDVFKEGGKIPPDGSAYHGFANEDYFSLLKDPSSPTGKRLFSFATKRGKKPSESLQVLIKGPSLLDCGSVVYLASSLALCELLSPEKFDTLFAPEGPSRFILTGDSASTAGRAMKKVLIQSEKEIQKGDIVYICNCKEYVAKHPAGIARGFNLICAEENPHKYLGFGLSSDPKTREEIEKSLWESFNEEPVDESFFPEFVWSHFYSKMLLCHEERSKELVRSLKNCVFTWEEYQKRSGRIDSAKYPMDGKMGLWVYRQVP